MANLFEDDFGDVSAWMPVASGLARLDIVRDQGPGGHAMRLDFDFAGGGGFVVARKTVAVTVTETWALCFAIKGAGPRNRLEIKLADPSGRNVWWYREEAFALPDTWQPLCIRSRDVEFAWGPAGGGALHEIGAIELALAAGPGGQGTLAIADLRIEDRTVRARPLVTTSSTVPGHAGDALFDARPAAGWRSEPTSAPQWVEVDFQGEREYGGLVFHWEPDGRARAFAVQTSHDGVVWETVHATSHADADRSYVYMPKTSARHLRLELRESVTGRGFGIRAIEVRPFEFSRSIETFFCGVAADAPRGSYPRYLVGEQTYWTPVGLPDGDTCALMNEEGMVEVDRGAFSLEPFLFLDDRLVTWADAAVRQELEHRYLPIPSSVWRLDGIVLRTTAFAIRCDGRAVLVVRYRVESTRTAVCALGLFTAVRPFQVNPPWQAFGKLGGASPIRALDGGPTAVRVDDRVVVPLAPADGFGAATCDQGNVVDALRTGTVPARAAVIDAFGYASGALRFDLEIAPGAGRDVYLAIPFGTTTGGDAARLPAGTNGTDALARAVADWRDKLERVQVQLAPRWQPYADSMRTALAHVLVERDGPALQPGPRRYTRSWIRDGAIMAAALLRMGCADEARQFVRWYAPFQAADGNVPCCVDRNGPDWLIEHDSHGELVFAVADCFRFTGDRAFLDELWPHVQRAVHHLETLRATRLGPEYDAPEKRAFRGLLPESASHEGYLAHPVHAYWDDFWAVRACGDAAELARVRGDRAEAERLTGLRDAFRASVRESMAATIATRKIDYVPGSVEWADFDPTATSNAISLLGETASMPRDVLDRTFAEYLRGFRRRVRNEIDWANYTAYEVRIIGALVHLGERASANELADFLLADQRPVPWHQWPEISWKAPRSPGHIGDVPHAWIAAEYILAFRTMLAFERWDDQALVLAAGIPEAWLAGGGEVVVDDLPTAWGRLGFTLRRAGADALALAVRGDLDLPPGGIVVRPPLPRALRGVEANGVALADFAADGVTVHLAPVDLVLRY